MTAMEAKAAPAPAPGPGALAVAHVADVYRRYPGDTVTFFTRVDVDPSLPGFTLRVALPPGLILADYHGPQSQALPRITLREGANSVIWWADSQPGETTRYEYQVMATVAPVVEETILESRAVATVEIDRDVALHESETVTLLVSPQGRYLDHLPALYHDDELLGRFLMLFESFWAPVSQQIDSLPYYFDPMLTPVEFLPWLASWIDLVLDERWPVDRRRRLLAAAAALYRKRGTRQGLEEYLEIYTGARPHIVEHRAHNFRLGQEARLGPGIALGRGNEPHTFTVVLCLPAVSTVGDPDGSPCEDEIRRRRIEAIIESEKPAHAGYRLRIETEGEIRELGNERSEYRIGRAE